MGGRVTTERHQGAMATAWSVPESGSAGRSVPRVGKNLFAQKLDGFWSGEVSDDAQQPVEKLEALPGRDVQVAVTGAQVDIRLAPLVRARVCKPKACCGAWAAKPWLMACWHQNNASCPKAWHSAALL